MCDGAKGVRFNDGAVCCDDPRQAKIRNLGCASVCLCLCLCLCVYVCVCVCVDILKCKHMHARTHTY